MDPKLKMLCELYDRSDESIDTSVLLKVCFFESLDEVLKLLSNKQCIESSYLCTKSVLHLSEHLSKSVKRKQWECWKLIEKWFKYPNNVCADNLFEVAYNCYFSSYNHVSRCVAHTAYSICEFIGGAGRDKKKACIYEYTRFMINHSSSAAKNKQKQKYKNLGFIIQVIKNEFKT